MEGETRRIKVSLTEDQPVDEGVRGSLQNFISGLAVPQKVELASKGNSEVRQILSRDPNKMVARAVILSPRLSMNDVAVYAASPLTNEEVLRAIGEEMLSRLFAPAYFHGEFSLLTYSSPSAIGAALLDGNLEGPRVQIGCAYP